MTAIIDLILKYLPLVNCYLLVVLVKNSNYMTRFHKQNAPD